MNDFEINVLTNILNGITKTEQKTWIDLAEKLKPIRHSGPQTVELTNDEVTMCYAIACAWRDHRANLDAALHEAIKKDRKD